jgi:hypothetical protein
MPEMNPDDRWYARRLPDDFVARTGDSHSRVLAIVTENWWGYESRALTRLIERLVPILEKLGSVGDVDDEVRGRCVEAVSGWLASLE